MVENFYRNARSLIAIKNLFSKEPTSIPIRLENQNLKKLVLTSQLGLRVKIQYEDKTKMIFRKP